MVPQKNKDIDAFRCLYDKYAPALYGIILKLTPDAQLASNILEKSFVKIWQEVNDYDTSKGRLFSLMLRVTVKACRTEAGISNEILPHLPIRKEHSAPLQQKMHRFFPKTRAQ